MDMLPRTAGDKRKLGTHRSADPSLPAPQASVSLEQREDGDEAQRAPESYVDVVPRLPRGHDGQVHRADVEVEEGTPPARREEVAAVQEPPLDPPERVPRGARRAVHDQDDQGEDHVVEGHSVLERLEDGAEEAQDPEEGGGQEGERDAGGEGPQGAVALLDEGPREEELAPRGRERLVQQLGRAVGRGRHVQRVVPAAA
mmetsp:Transcript_10122/g.29984  ORF Transcript_10122/g.29984 Transcript_10122/m.29984 type:complete len:200 (-) Transcript_10122:851-1450(-)